MLFTGEGFHHVIIDVLINKKASPCETIQDNHLEYGEVRRIPCRPQAVGKFVRLTQNQNVKAYFVFCEVEVYGMNGM